MISANTLFHYTSQYDILLKILDSNVFKPSLCIDNYLDLIPDKSRNFDNYAIPMVCFCDIPLSQIKDHTEIYGNYAIGLDKDWGIKSGLNPVLYLTKCDGLTEAYQNLSDTYLRTIKKSSADIEKQIVQVLQYIKPYRGKRWIKNDSDFDINTIEFYTEREWRYVPDKIEKCIVPYKNFVDFDKKNTLHSELELCCPLEFCADDIKYIIVKSERQVNKLIDHILNKLTFRNGGCSKETKKLLCSKILTMEQITQDF